MILSLKAKKINKYHHRLVILPRRPLTAGWSFMYSAVPSKEQLEVHRSFYEKLFTLLPANESADITKEPPKEKASQSKTDSNSASKPRPATPRADKQHKAKDPPAKIQKPRPAQSKVRPGFEGGVRVVRMKKSGQK